MDAYWIGFAEVTDLAGFAEYGRAVQEIAGAKRVVLARTADLACLEGKTTFNRVSLLHFPSTEAALEYYHSPAYQAAMRIRQAACRKCSLVLVPGLTS